jgi:hypothetical protein
VGAAYLDASGAGNFRACIFRDGRAWNLNDLISPLPDWVLREATGINNRGQIIVWAAYRDTTQEQAFLLTPLTP